VLHIALEVPLRALDTGGHAEGHHSRATGVQRLDEALDDPALAGGVTAFEEDDDARPHLLDPILQLDQLSPNPLQLAFIEALVEPASSRLGRRAIMLGHDRHFRK